MKGDVCKLKLLSLFSGIGAFEKALKNLGIPFELVGYSEIDKFASSAYSILHDVPESMNLGDITKIDAEKLPDDIDLVTYGFPCQDISIAGKMKGFRDSEGNVTRSGLFFEALRIIEATKPKYAIAENVSALSSEAMRDNFNTVLESLDAAGYVNYWKCLSADHFGIPQTRDRIFIVSIRRDIFSLFAFPQGVSTDKKLKDYLEENVPEEYFIKPEILEKMIIHEQSHAGGICDSDSRANTLLARDRKQPKAVKIKSNTVCGYEEAHAFDSIQFAFPGSGSRRGRVGNGVAHTMTTQATPLLALPAWSEGEENGEGVRKPESLRQRSNEPRVFSERIRADTEDCERGGGVK